MMVMMPSCWGLLLVFSVLYNCCSSTVVVLFFRTQKKSSGNTRRAEIDMGCWGPDRGVTTCLTSTCGLLTAWAAWRVRCCGPRGRLTEVPPVVVDGYFQSTTYNNMVKKSKLKICYSFVAKGYSSKFIYEAEESGRPYGMHKESLGGVDKIKTTRRKRQATQQKTKENGR